MKKLKKNKKKKIIIEYNRKHGVIMMGVYRKWLFMIKENKKKRNRKKKKCVRERMGVYITNNHKRKLVQWLLEGIETKKKGQKSFYRGKV